VSAGIRKPLRRKKRLIEYEREMAGSLDAASVLLGSGMGDFCGWQLRGMVAGCCPKSSPDTSAGQDAWLAPAISA
jgi:hypothetical protein